MLQKITTQKQNDVFFYRFGFKKMPGIKYDMLKKKVFQIHIQILKFPLLNRVFSNTFKMHNKTIVHSIFQLNLGNLQGTTDLNSTTLIAFLYLVTPFSWLVNKPSLKSVHRNQLCRNEMIIQNCVGCELYTRNFDSQKLKNIIPKFQLFSKRSLDLIFFTDTLFSCLMYENY